MSGLDTAAVVALYDAVISHAKTTALFNAGVTDHEPLNPPATGLSCAVLLGPLVPVGRASGLSVTSGRLEFQIRVYSPRLAQPGGSNDRTVLAAASTLIGAYSGDFELTVGNIPAGLVRNVDLLGAYGAALQMTPGWLLADGAPFRVCDVTLPLILNDLWCQKGAS